MRSELKKGFVKATSNPDPRNAQPVARRRSQGKGVPGRGNSRSSAQRPEVPAVPGNSKPPCMATPHCTHRGTQKGGKKKRSFGVRPMTALELGLYSVNCEKLREF